MGNCTVIFVCEGLVVVSRDGLEVEKDGMKARWLRWDLFKMLVLGKRGFGILGYCGNG